MPELTCTLSSGLWRLLQQYSEKTKQPAAHIVSKALAEFFELISSSMALLKSAMAASCSPLFW